MITYLYKVLVKIWWYIWAIQNSAHMHRFIYLNIYLMIMFLLQWIENVIHRNNPAYIKF